VAGRSSQDPVLVARVEPSPRGTVTVRGKPLLSRTNDAGGQPIRDLLTRRLDPIQAGIKSCRQY
jgi:hypothetical protein